ncbi:MAG: hypothetical protein IPP19_06040 [Verrucomicrobia bacterium]|nr:hypothetical protein [Verrucomicrobiota bacterium]
MKPFLTGRTQIQSANLQNSEGVSPAEAVARAAAHKHSKETGGPSVETVKQGDKIVRLIVTCSCGERIEIDCLYPAGG